MNVIWLLVIILVVLALVGAPGVGPWTHNLGYAPSGVLTLVIIVLIVLLLMGRL